MEEFIENKDTKEGEDLLNYHNSDVEKYWPRIREIASFGTGLTGVKYMYQKEEMQHGSNGELEVTIVIKKY